MLLEQRYPSAAEIPYAAVAPNEQRRGIGSALVDAALDTARASGVVLVEVERLDASAGYAPYDGTRAFWHDRAFRQVDCIDPLPGWQPGNPSAIYVAALAPTRPIA